MPQQPQVAGTRCFPTPHSARQLPAHNSVPAGQTQVPLEQSPPVQGTGQGIARHSPAWQVLPVSHRVPSGFGLHLPGLQRFWPRFLRHVPFWQYWHTLQSGRHLPDIASLSVHPNT
jgi:hypothetical protein